MHSPFDLLALLLVISAGLAYLNHRALKLPLTVGLLVGAAAGTLLLIALDAVVPGLGLKLAIRGLVASINFPATLLDGFLAFLLFAGALQVNSADMFSRKWTILALAISRHDPLNRIGCRGVACCFVAARARYIVTVVSRIRRFDLAHRPGLGP